jgi:hypothetical protein
MNDLRDGLDRLAVKVAVLSVKHDRKDIADIAKMLRTMADRLRPLPAYHWLGEDADRPVLATSYTEEAN